MEEDVLMALCRTAMPASLTPPRASNMDYCLSVIGKEPGDLNKA